MADLAVWQRTIVDEKGDIIPGAEVSVRSYPGGSLITLYEGPDGTQVKGNPFSTGTDGFARFWAESQRAEIVAYGAGSTIRWVVDLLNADEVIGDAVSEATAAAAVAVGEAEAAADRAEAARDAAQINAHIYPNTAAGLAATTDGDYFSVPSPDIDDYLILYLNDNGSATEISRYPSTEGVRDITIRATVARWRLSDGDVSVTPGSGNQHLVGWSNLRVLTGAGAPLDIEEREESALIAGNALYIDTEQEGGPLVVTEGVLNNTLQASFVNGTNFLLLSNRGGQLFGPLATTGALSQLESDKLSVADADLRDRFSLIRLINMTGTGDAANAEIPTPLSGVQVDSLVAWRSQGTNTGPVTLTFGGQTYPVKNRRGEDFEAGALPAALDLIGHIRGDGTIRVIGVQDESELPTLRAIKDAITRPPAPTEPVIIVFDPTTGEWTTISLDEVAAPMKKLYDLDVSGAAGTSPQTIIASEDEAQQVTLANVATEGNIAAGLGGQVPSLNGSGSLTLASGAVLSMDYPPAGAVTVTADVEGVAFTARVKTARPFLVTHRNQADALFDRYEGTALTAQQQSAVRDLYAAFYPVLDQFLYLFVLAAPTADLALMDWAGDGSATPVNSPAFDPGQGYTFNGSNQHILTGKTWQGSGFGDMDRVMMAVAVDGTVNSAVRATLSAGITQIAANSSSGAHAFRSAATAGEIIGGSEPGGLIVMQRSDLYRYTTLRNGVQFGEGYRQQTPPIPWGYEHVIGAGTGSAGPTNPSTHWAGQVQLAIAGNPLPERTWQRLTAAWQEYLTRMEGA